MSCVGNDLVDLTDPEIAGSHERDRFVQRICNATEVERVAGARKQDRKRLLWTLFAAKEAAFKVVSKLGPPPVFAHREFVVSDDLRSVRHEGRMLALEVENGPDWVHAVATSGQGDAIRGVEPLAAGNPSSSARSLLTAAVAGQLGFRAAELRVDRPDRPGSWDGFGPPHLLRGDQLLPVDVSLSHDGRFVAYAAQFEQG